MTTWRWANVPLPEPYLAALGAAVGIDYIVPVRPPVLAPGWLGAGLAAGGVALVGWAVISAADADVDSSDRLVQSGAYAVTRNPMYLGWSTAVLGWAIASRHAWLVAAWAVATRLIHREVMAEERALESRHPAAFRDYSARVPRYLPRITARQSTTPVSR